MLFSVKIHLKHKMSLCKILESFSKWKTMYNRKVFYYIASILSLSFTVFSSHKSQFPWKKRCVALYRCWYNENDTQWALFCGGFSGWLVCFFLCKKHWHICLIFTRNAKNTKDVSIKKRKERNYNTIYCAPIDIHKKY